MSAGAPLWRSDEHEVERWCRMLRQQGVPTDPSRLDLRPPPPGPMAELAGATIVHPGASTPARRWPPGRWAQVARAERERGRRVAVTGGAAEVPLARKVAELAGLPPEWVLAGSLGVMELAALVGVAGLMLCADTGVAHLATALRTPSVVLFGPTPPALWGSPADRPWHRALWAGVTGPPSGTLPHPGLLQVTVEQVLQAAAGLPRRSVRSSR